jgi:hypothetical protein
MVEAARIYRELAEQRLEPDDARFRLSRLDLPGAMVDGYARGVAGSQPHPAA